MHLEELSIMLFPLLEEQPRVFLLFHILPRRFFLPQLLLPYKYLLFGQHTTKKMKSKVTWKLPMPIFKNHLTIIYLTLSSQPLLQYPKCGQLTAAPIPSK